MGKVTWNGRRLKMQVAEAQELMVDKAAFMVEAQTKLNIQANQQIDVGFMLNTVYVITPRSDTYSVAWKSGHWYSPKAGQTVQRDLASPQNAPPDGAVVAVGAIYALYQELKLPFLYPALARVAGSMGGQVVAAGKGAF
jgi:hypothetical protein